MNPRSSRRLSRWMALVLAGGVGFQFIGCATALVPVALSVAEAAIASFVLTRLVGP